MVVHVCVSMAIISLYFNFLAIFVLQAKCLLTSLIKVNAAMGEDFISIRPNLRTTPFWVFHVFIVHLVGCSPRPQLVLHLYLIYRIIKYTNKERQDK